MRDSHDATKFGLQVTQIGLAAPLLGDSALELQLTGAVGRHREHFWWPIVTVGFIR